MSWAGPNKIGDFLNSVAHSPWKRPPEKAGVYVVSDKPWEEVPATADGVLYVGQATYLRYQIGRLLCDLLGFTGDNPSGEEAYQHKGGPLYGRTTVCHAKSSLPTYISDGARSVCA
jgi:hypothetical protein